MARVTPPTSPDPSRTSPKLTQFTKVTGTVKSWGFFLQTDPKNAAPAFSRCPSKIILNQYLRFLCTNNPFHHQSKSDSISFKSWFPARTWTAVLPSALLHAAGSEMLRYQRNILRCCQMETRGLFQRHMQLGSHWHRNRTRAWTQSPDFVVPYSDRISMEKNSTGWNYFSLKQETWNCECKLYNILQRIICGRNNYNLR